MAEPENKGLESSNIDSEDDMDMAAAMGMSSDDSPMSQDEINKLMGDKKDDNNVTFDTVIEDIIYMSMLNYEKLPMLDVIFERFILEFTTALKTLTSATTDIQLKSLEYKSYNKSVKSLPVPGVLGVINAEPWNGQFLISTDAPMVYTALEIMLGGRKSKPAPAEGRNFTSIERKIAEKIIKTSLREMTLAFNPLTDVKFEIDRVETNPQFATVAQPNSACIQVSMEVIMEKRVGNLNIIIPYSTLEPVRKLLSKVFFGERLGGDTIWKKHLTSEIKSSVVLVKAIFDEKPFSLNDVKNWKVGETLHFDADPKKSIRLLCEKHELFEGKLGRKNKDKMAVRIEKDLGNQENLINDITNN